MQFSGVIHAPRTSRSAEPTPSGPGRPGPSSRPAVQVQRTARHRGETERFEEPSAAPPTLGVGVQDHGHLTGARRLGSFDERAYQCRPDTASRLQDTDQREMADAWVPGEEPFGPTVAAGEQPDRVRFTIPVTRAGAANTLSRSRWSSSRAPAAAGAPRAHHRSARPRSRPHRPRCHTGTAVQKCPVSRAADPLVHPAVPRRAGEPLLRRAERVRGAPLV